MVYILICAIVVIVFLICFYLVSKVDREKRKAMQNGETPPEFSKITIIVVPVLITFAITITVATIETKYDNPVDFFNAVIEVVKRHISIDEFLHPSNSDKLTGVKNPLYNTYSNDEYGFSISYPSHFIVYNDGGIETLYTVRSSDGRTREIIAATSTKGKTVDLSINDYIAGHIGDVQYKAIGEDYYAVNINDGETEYYKYCKFKNGNMYWFEFVSPSMEHDIYDKYINDIYNSLSFN